MSKKIVLYDSALEKHVCRTLKRENFNSDEEMAEYIKVLRDEMRAKNKEHKRANTRKAIENKLKEGVVVPQPQPTPTLVLPKSLEATSDVSLRLDKTSGNTTLILGSSKRGKSTLMMYLYNKYYAYQVNPESINTLFSGNPHLKLYREDPKLLITEGFGTAHAKYIQMQKYINTKTKNRYKFCNFFDDIISAKHSSIVNSMVLSYRNSNISMVMCLQYLFMFSKQNRANVNNTFVFGANNAEDEEGLINHVLKPYFVELGFKTYAEQVVLFRECTRDYGFFYLDNLKNKMITARLQI